MINSFIVVNPKFLIYILFFYKLSCFAQLSLTPLLGFDFAKIEDKDEIISFNQLVITQSGFTAINANIGAKIEYKFLNDFIITAHLQFGSKKVSSYFSDLASFQSLKFNCFQNGFSFNYKIIQHFSIGLGWKYNILNNFSSLAKSGYSHKHDFSFRDYGPGMVANYYWRRYEIGAYFYKGLNDNFDNKSALSIYPIDSFGVYLGYKFSFPNLFKGKSAANCPTFKR